MRAVVLERNKMVSRRLQRYFLAAGIDPILVEDPKEVAAAAAGDEMVKCFGINECKGESACNVNKPELGIEHSCAGENDCKGKGWIKVARSECDSKGGEVL